MWMRTALSVAAAASAVARGKDTIMSGRNSMRTGSLARAVGWLNSPELDSADLRERVVLFDFWTYTCINWRRTLPWLRSWAERYRDQGLVVIGVHTPEFEFEKDIDNVRRAVKAQGVDYPVAIDSNYEIWDAFENRYWPALYLVDAQGRVRHRQFGEGDYDQIEAIIVNLLVESGRKLAMPHDHTPMGQGAEATADWQNLRSPETYLGQARSAEPARDGLAPAGLKLNQWVLIGSWSTRRESTISRQPHGSIAMRFHARDLHLVMGPASRDTRVRFRVSLDGEEPGEARGVDVDARGLGTIEQPRMYTLIRQSSPIPDRLFEIEFLDPGAEVFVFTFG